MGDGNAIYSKIRQWAWIQKLAWQQNFCSLSLSLNPLQVCQLFCSLNVSNVNVSILSHLRPITMNGLAFAADWDGWWGKRRKTLRSLINKTWILQNFFTLWVWFLISCWIISASFICCVFFICLCMVYILCIFFWPRLLIRKTYDCNVIIVRVFCKINFSTEN